MTRPTPHQLGLLGGEVPEEAVNAPLVEHGFLAWRSQGVMRYADPFRLGVHLYAPQARKLLAERMLVVAVGGYRVRFPGSAYSEVRIGQRRATQEGAWHELRKATGEATSGRACAPGYWIIDGASNARVWPPDEQRARAIEIDDLSDCDD